MANPANSTIAVWRKHLTAYSFACIVSALLIRIHLLLEPWLGHQPAYILFILPIIFSAYVGGLGPGLAATAICAWGIQHFMVAKEHNILFFEGSIDLWNWAGLIASGTLVSLLIEALHRAHRNTETANQLHTVTLASIGDAVITTDNSGRVTFLNAEAERLTEWTSAGAQGHSLAEVFHIVNQATRSPVEDPAEKVLRTGMVASLANHTLLLGRKGRETVIEDSGAPIRNPDGSITGAVLVFRDATEKVQAEDALRESQALYHSLVEQMPAGVFRKDAAGRYVYVNAFFCTLHETNPEEFLGKFPHELPAAKDAFKAQAVQHHEQIMRTGQPVKVDEQHHFNGRTHYLHAVKTPVFDSNGKIIGSQGFLLDISQRINKEAELARSQQAIQEQERLMREVIDLVPHFIYARDRQGRFLFANRTCAEAAGMTVEEMAGRNCLEFAPNKAQAEASLQTDREVLESGQARFYPEVPLTDVHGVHYIVESIKIPFTMPGHDEPALMGVAVDITERKRLETELRTAIERTKFFMNHIPLGFIAWDREFRVAEWNAAAEAIFGWTAAEAKGRHAYELVVPPDARGQTEQIWKQIITGSQPGPAITENLARDGRRVICEWRHAPWHDASGEIRGCLSLVGDITDKKRAEENFAREQARFKLIFDAAPIGIAFQTVYPDGTRVRNINQAHLRLAGITRAQHEEPDIYERITHPDDRDLRRPFEQEVTAGLRRQYALEKRYVHADGRVVWVSFTYQREIYPDGTTEELTTVTDITQRKAAEQQSRQLAVIVESSEDAIISHSLDGTIISWNRGAESIFGYSAEETIGQPMLPIYPPELMHESAEILARIGRGENVEHSPTERIRKDGKRIRISATVSPLRDAHGHIVGAATIARDVSRQHQLEEQLRQSQKMEAIGQLAGGVAHDFNNILAIIQMQVELFRCENQFLPEQTACLDVIQSAASRGANLTRQLLLFSRRQRLQPRDLDLSESIAGMTKMFRRILGEDIQIHFKYASQPLFVHADPGMIDQILMNLTLNSRDAMPTGGELIIEAAAAEFDALAALQSPQARPGSFARLSVRDTGSGIRPEILPRIFEPFFTTKDVGKGTGLGLATVFSIVQQHQGWIHVISEPGHGTTFDIYLPRLIRNTIASKETTAGLTAVPGGTETILLVEDDDALRASVRLCLTQLGYHLLEAATAVAALRVWEQHRDQIQLLLSDLIMPGGMTGKELGEQLRLENPQLKIIYVSGYSADILTQDLAAVPGVTFLAKPFAARTLALQVRASLDTR